MLALFSKLMKGFSLHVQGVGLGLGLGLGNKERTKGDQSHYYLAFDGDPGHLLLQKLHSKFLTRKM